MRRTGTPQLHRRLFASKGTDRRRALATFGCKATGAIAATAIHGCPDAGTAHRGDAGSGAQDTGKTAAIAIAGAKGGGVDSLARASARQLRFDFLIKPTFDHVEHLLAVVLDHHEVAVAEDAFVLQLQIFDIAATLFQ